jgi:hypothetical protein
MKRLLVLSIVLLFAGIAHAGIGTGWGYQPAPQARSRYSPPPSYTIRQRAYSMQPTYDWSDDRGNSGYMRQRPYSLTPTWDSYGPNGSRGTLRQRPYSITPTWDFGR